MVDRTGIPGSQGLPDQIFNHIAVLGMDHYQCAFPLGGLQRLVQHAVVGLEGVLVGHEYLKRSDAFVLNNLRQLAKHLVIQL
ncbi:hypothetical protein D3C74_391340 [compost metagenome]